MPKLEDDRFTVTVFDRAGRVGVRSRALREGQARVFAERHRPPLCASYTTREGKELNFKPYRQVVFTQSEKVRYESTSKARLSNKRIAAAAKRFAADGEYENAVAMLELTR